MKHTLEGQRVWVTGASSGIGAALATELSRRGSRLAISGRNRERLEEVAASCPGDTIVVPFDVADREANQEAASHIRRELYGLDIAVLNAGTCEYIDLPGLDVERIRRVMEINFMGLVYGTEAALELLQGAPSPYLVGMSSTVAYTGLPRAEAYGTSKAAIRYFLQSLRADLVRHGVDVSIIYPGFVRTPLTDVNDFPMPMRITADRAARAICKGLEKRQHDIRFPWAFALGLRLLGILPSRMRNRLLVPLSRSRPREATQAEET